jgi:hypothetical protein
MSDGDVALSSSVETGTHIINAAIADILGSGLNLP